MRVHHGSLTHKNYLVDKLFGSKGFNLKERELAFQLFKIASMYPRHTVAFNVECSKYTNERYVLTEKPDTTVLLASKKLKKEARRRDQLLKAWHAKRLSYLEERVARKGTIASTTTRHLEHVHSSIIQPN